MTAESTSQRPAFTLADLVPMQDGFRRSRATLQKMFDFVRAGGRFDPETLHGRDSGRATPIILNRFEDGRVYIHDGLHRAAAILAARDSAVIDEDEYEVDSYTYQEYDELNIDVGYLTPFDPRREVRVADLSGFHQRARSVIDAGDDLESFVKNHRHSYARPREPHHSSLDRMLRFFHPDLLPDS